jgi:hypothetical protein
MQLFLGMEKSLYTHILSTQDRTDRIERKRNIAQKSMNLGLVKNYFVGVGGVCEVRDCCEPAYGEVVYGVSGERHWVCRGHFELFRREPFVDRGIFKPSPGALL